MNWKLKAKIQNIISLLPSTISYEVYYLIQRYFGGLRNAVPTSRFIAAIETWKRIQSQGYNPKEKVFLEVGTGRAPLIPIAYWLMGAKNTITIDLNPYLKECLVAEHLRYISQNKNYILELFGSLIDRKRFNALVNLNLKSKRLVSSLLDLCHITYIAPGDASDTNLPEQYIDFHTSYTVFEHITPNILVDILKEGNRIIKTNGLFIHRIDYSDHFSHSDKSISAINFLQYSDDEWAKYAGNRYMYMNRYRHDDILTLFESVGQHIVAVEPNMDKISKKLLKKEKLKLNAKFNLKTQEVLAIRSAWVLTKANG